MLIRPPVVWNDEREMHIRSRTNVTMNKRGIYVDAIPNIDSISKDPEWRETFSSYITVTLVNRSIFSGGPLFMKDGDWTFLKSIYIFSTHVQPDQDPFMGFKTLNLYPQRIMTTGYTSKHGKLIELGMSVIDVDRYSFGFPMSPVLTRYDRLKAIDPRCYSDADHLLHTGNYPEDYLPGGFYKGEDLVDENTNIFRGMDPVGFNFISDSAATTDQLLPIEQHQIMHWRSMFIHNASVDLFYPPSAGAIDTLMAIYDTNKGIKIDSLKVPSFLPNDFAQKKAVEFSNNLKRVGDRISANLGNVRMFYYTSDHQDRLKVFYHKDGSDGVSKDYTVLNLSRSDILDDILTKTAPIR